MRHVRIAWLWGAPRAVSLVRAMKPLLAAQGVSIALSHPSTPVEADSVVIPPASDPEHRLVDERLYRASLIVEDDDEQRALYRALSPPEGTFTLLRIGIDPGAGGCGYAAFGDSLLISVGRAPCDNIGHTVRGLVERAPAWDRVILVGDGPGLAMASLSLELESLDYRIVSEAGTSGGRPPYLPRVVKDRDAIAAVRIALRPSY